MNAAEQLALYRSRHVIRPVETTGAGRYANTPFWVCEVDRLRIHRRRSKGRDLFLHDSDAIRRLVKDAARSGWTESELRFAAGDR